MIALSEQPLEVAALLDAVADPEHGGIATFLGTTRREGGEREVEALDYEAYEELALAEMRAVAAEAEARFGARVAVAHRVGRVEVGRPSVAVAASAGHRPEAFAACRYVIDELKRRVPIWKRTVYADGGTTWVDGCALRGHAHAVR
jgi:molybdopterin synthase catalytic subunit